MPVNNLIKIRNGSSSAWGSANPVLASGEPGYDSTNNLVKIGDGTTAWSGLAAIGGTSSTSGIIGSGTANYISKFSSTSGISNSIIYESGSNIGVGTTSPTYKLQVNGSFGATTKSFNIQHPTKPNYRLEYGSLESPYHGVRLTGRGKVVKGVGIVELPEYIKELVRDDENINIQITNIKHSKILYIDSINLQKNNFVVKAHRAKTLGDLDFFWTFTATRKDVDQLVVERPE